MADNETTQRLLREMWQRCSRAGAALRRAGADGRRAVASGRGTWEIPDAADFAAKLLSEVDTMMRDYIRTTLTPKKGGGDDRGSGRKGRTPQPGR